MGKKNPQSTNNYCDYPKIREQLIAWGAKNFKYTNDQGKIIESRYLNEVLKPEIHCDKFGELTIPEELVKLIRNKYFNKEVRLGLLSAMMGYGHRRTANVFGWCAKSLGINATEICFGDNRQSPVTTLDKVFMAVNKEYFRASNREAIKTQMLTSGDEYIPEYKTGIIGTVATLLRKIMPSTYDSLFLGKSNAKINEKSVYLARKYLRYLFMVSIKTKLNKYKVSHIINFYPLLNFLLNQEAVTVATDAVVNPLGWTPLVRQVLERKEAVEKFSGFSQKLKDNLEYGNGFAAPVAGLIKANYLAKRRAEKLRNGFPLTIVLPASQVATAQLQSFKDLITSRDNVRIVVQCGDGRAGEHLKEKLEQSCGRQDNVIYYNAATPEAAIEFTEVWSGNDIPWAIGVKASELSRMAVELHVPHIALGAIGDQELWNLTVGLIQGAPLILTPKAYTQITDFILGKTFKESEKDWLLAKAEMARAIDIKHAIEKAREIILLGNNNIVPVQRDFMLKVLAFVFTGRDEVFYPPSQKTPMSDRE